MIFTNNFLAQIIGAFAILFWVVSVHGKKQYKILFLQALANLLYTFQYILLGVFPAASMNICSCFRSYIFYRKRKEDKDISNVWLLFFIFLIILVGGITYNGYLSLIPIIITLFYTVSSWMKESTWIRIVFLVAAFVWIYYNYKVGAYITIVGNIFEVVSGILALIKFYGKDEKNNVKK